MDTTGKPGRRQRVGEAEKGAQAGEERGGEREERTEGAWWNSHIILQRLIAIRGASAIFSSFLSNSTDPPRNG